MAMITPAPADSGKSMVQLTSEQLSYIFPIPESAKSLTHTDSQLTISFDTAESAEEVFAFYKRELAKSNWTATTEKPLEISFALTLIFSNSKKELIEVTTRTAAAKTQVRVTYQTAETVAELNAKAKKSAEEAKEKRETEKLMQETKESTLIPVRIAKLLKPTESGAKSIRWELPSGRGASTVKALIESLESDGWKTKAIVAESIVGDYEFTKQDWKLRLNLTDPGFIPAEVKLTVSGAGNLKAVTD